MLDFDLRVMDSDELDALLAEVDRRLDALFDGDLETALGAEPEPMPVPVWATVPAHRR